MILPVSPETLAPFKQGQEVSIKEFPGMNFIVTRLGFCTMDELKMHPLSTK